MATHTAVITGANRGIGLELCRYCKENKINVIGVCRTTSDDLEQLAIQVINNIDLTSNKQLNILRAKLAGQAIDILINNAGILISDSLDNINTEGTTQQFDVNALAPLQTTITLLDLMTPNSKVAFITSRMGSIADNTSGGYYGYRMSKAALNAAAKSLAKDLSPKKIAIGIIHPGFVQTKMTGFNGDVNPEVAAKNIFQRITELNLQNSGTFWHANGDVLPW